MVHLELVHSDLKNNSNLLVFELEKTPLALKYSLGFMYNLEKVINEFSSIDIGKKVLNKELIKKMLGKGLFRKSKIKFLGDKGDDLKKIDKNLFENIKDSRPLWMPKITLSI